MLPVRSDREIIDNRRDGERQVNVAQPWKTIESVATEEGTLELRQRGERDFLITIGSQVLMNSLSNRSEVVLGQLGCGT